METLTDIGTVRLFNVGTLADGVLRVWFGTGDRGAAAELATALLVAAVVLIASERLLRRGARFAPAAAERRLRPRRLAGPAAAAATAAVLAVVAVAVGVPLVRLVAWAAGSAGAATVAGGLGHHVGSTLTVAGAAAATCLVAGTVLALSARRRSRPDGSSAGWPRSGTRCPDRSWPSARS